MKEVPSNWLPLGMFSWASPRAILRIKWKDGIINSALECSLAALMRWLLPSDSSRLAAHRGAGCCWELWAFCKFLQCSYCFCFHDSCNYIFPFMGERTFFLYGASNLRLGFWTLKISFPGHMCPHKHRNNYNIQLFKPAPFRRFLPHWQYSILCINSSPLPPLLPPPRMLLPC